MRNHTIVNLIKNFDPKGHHYKDNTLARSFGWWWAEQCLASQYDELDRIESQMVRECEKVNLDYEARRIATGELWTASNREIIEWFKAHGTKRHRQLVKAYLMIPYIRLEY